MNETDDTPWQKATASAGSSGCVQLRRQGRVARLRDSKLGKASPVLDFNHTELAAFLAGVKDGEFDHLLDGLD